ncbi:hypothetical protein C0995_015644 [Termitomyces sp. Mi166|nr:hypothetical protein C0995_015644 [Termitomyces sp. Mi166\
MAELWYSNGWDGFQPPTTSVTHQPHCWVSVAALAVHTPPTILEQENRSWGDGDLLLQQEFFKNLGRPASEAIAEVWADRILMFSKLYELGDLSLHQLELLQGDALLHDKLHDLVTEIQIFSLLGEFGNPTNAACSFHIQKGTTTAQ